MEEDIFDEDGALTPRFLLSRGYCCGNGCRHCPYVPRHGGMGARPAADFLVDVRGPYRDLPTDELVMLMDGVPEVRRVVLCEILERARRGDARAMHRLVQALGDDDYEVSDDAAHFVQSSTIAADDALLEVVIGADRDAQIWYMAAQALCVRGDVRAFEPVLAVLQDNRQDCDLRTTAALALARLGDPRATGPLSEIVTNKIEPRLLRNRAVTSLKELGDVTAIDALLSVASDPDIGGQARWAVDELRKKYRP